MKLNAKNSVGGLVIFFSILVVDQFTKWFIVHRGINYFCNIDGPFGLAGNFPVISATILFILFVLLTLEKDRKIIIALLLILAAGFSNLLDRIVHGCVLDFINLGFWPVFNFADAIITIAAIRIIYRKAISVNI